MPHSSLAMGNMDLSHMVKAVLFEEAGDSWLGPTASIIYASHEGNTHLIGDAATERQKERWLRPHVEGHTRSCFAKTESDGAGADPTVRSTAVTREGDDYLIEGTKWFITGAQGADNAIVMARMPGGSATMSMTDLDRPGIFLDRCMEPMDRCIAGGHGVLRFENVRVPTEDILGDVDKGVGRRGRACFLLCHQEIQVCGRGGLFAVQAGRWRHGQAHKGGAGADVVGRSGLLESPGVSAVRDLGQVERRYRKHHGASCIRQQDLWHQLRCPGRMVILTPARPGLVVRQSGAATQ